MAQQDDSAYQQNPYGMTNPTQLFQQLSTQNQDRGAMGQISQGAMQAGFNPQMQQAQQIQQTMAQILGQVGPPQDNEDPIDYQMRQAKAVSTGLASVSPMMAMNADQQMLRLQNAKDQQNKLSADTQYEQSETAKNKVNTAQAAADPMVQVSQGKDSLGLPTYNLVGKPVSMFDENNNVRTGWSNDVQQQAQENPGTQSMRQSQYNALVEKMNEGKYFASMSIANQRAQMQLAQLSLLNGPQQQAALSSQADDIVARRTAMPPQPPVGSRNPAAMQTWATLKNLVDQKQDALTPGEKFDNSDFGNNVKQENKWNGGPDSDAVRKISVATSHLQDLETYSHDIAQYGPDSPITNAASQKVQMWLGAGPVEYTTANRRVAGEITSAVIGKNAALADRESAEHDTAAKLAASQKSGSYDALDTMLYDQAAGLRAQYLGGFRGMTDAEKAARWNAKLTPEAQNLMAQTDAAKGVNAVGNPISGSSSTVQSTAAARAAATPGARVIMLAPDGKQKGYVSPADVARLKASGYTMVQQ